MAVKVRDSIKEKVGKATLAELMHATNIFGRGFGLKKFNLILLKEPRILTDSTLSPSEKVTRIASVEGLAKKTAEQFVSQIPSFIAFLTEADLLNKLEEAATHLSLEAAHLEAAAKDTSHPLYGKKFIMTGVRDKELLEKLLKLGAEQGSAVRKDTFVVLVKDTEQENSKIAEAKTLNIPIMTLDEFKLKYTL